ncbi:MAG: hypothetical protein R2911_17155 [Caldilineaceae bacterium]
MFQGIQTPVDGYLHELRTLVRDLGRNGGQISPSVYDTAQVLRLYPPFEGAEAGLEWIAGQQQADGGWGHPDVPLARDVPTLAAVLALHLLRRDRAAQEMVKAGLAFLRSQAAQWADVHFDLLPIAVEMILPYLIDEANAVGLHVDRLPYRWLYQVKAKKQQMLAKTQIAPATAPMHSWEALGNHAPRKLFDRPRSIGHSPAATAQWLKSAQGHPELANERAAAEEYLENAAAATGMDIPGVVPTVWPITGFELAYAPHALLLTNIVHHPGISSALEPIISQVHTILREQNGLSFGHYFTPDVDVTGVASVVLQAFGHSVDADMLMQFRNGDHFYTYQYELNPSVFSNAHALHALAVGNHRLPAVEQFLKDRQLIDGRWMADKWHSSWIYTTTEVIYALIQCGRLTEVRKAGKALLNAQHSDGGWGSGVHSTGMDTGFALIALRVLQKKGIVSEAEGALMRGYDWLRQQCNSSSQRTELLWMGKELYAPYRVDRVYQLCAILSAEIERVTA